MSLGALAIVEKVSAVGPVFHMRCSLLGDGAYSSGGSTGLLAKVKAALNDDQVNIIAVIGESDPATDDELEYDHANEKLFARVRTTGVESAVANQAAITYHLYIVAG